MEISRIDPFLDYFERVRERTRRVVACIPPEHLEWTHRPGAFTFGDLIRHLGAIERYMFVENALGRPSRYPGHGRDLAEGYDAVLAFFDEMHRQSLELLRDLGPEDLQRRCDARRSPPARLEMVAFHGGARDPPPRPDLPDARDPRRPDPAQ